MNNEHEREGANVSTKLTYLLVGGAIGAVVALLFAPKSGKELREDIADVTRNGLEKGRETFSKFSEKAESYYEVTREKAGEILHDAQEKVEGLGDKAREAVAAAKNPFTSAIDAGKDAYIEEKRRNESRVIREGRPTYPVEKEG
ncbi:MAG: YtxH domain-containing protein [Acidobacteriota bacterium]|jgi:gas vesicle protein